MKFLARRRLILVVFILAFIVGFFHRFAPATFAERIAHDLSLAPAALGAIASAYFWTYTLLQVPAGAVVDRWGGRLTVSVGLVIVSVASVAFSQATSVSGLFVTRLLVGAGISVLFVAIMRNHAHWYKPGEYATVVGLTMLFGNLGAVFSSRPLAALLDYFIWRDIFLWLSLVTFVFGCLAYYFVRDTPEQCGYPASPETSQKEAGSHGQATARSLLSPALLACFIAGVGTNATFYSFAGLWGAPLLVDSFSVSVKEATNYVTAALLVYGGASYAIGVLADKLGSRRPLIILMAVFSVVSWSILIGTRWQPGLVPMLAYTMLGASGAQMVLTFATVKDLVGIARAGTALAVANTCVFLGVAIIQPLFGVVLDYVGNGEPLGFEDYRAAMLVCLVSAAVSLLATLGIPETGHGRTSGRA